MPIHTNQGMRAAGYRLPRRRRVAVAISLMALPTIAQAFVWGSGSWGGSTWGGGVPVAVPALPLWGLLGLIVAVGLVPRVRSRCKSSTRFQGLNRRKS